MTRAFLLGAGVTRAAYDKAPLANDFLVILKQRKSTLYGEIEDAVSPYLVANRRLYKENIETIMGMSYQFSPSAQISFLSSVHSAIYELLAEITESTETDIKPYLAGRKTLRQRLLKTMLNDKRLSENDFFMTLNYDLYLDREVMFAMNQKKINYGIKGDFLQLNSVSLPLMEEPIFSVYHLHGSLNWEMVGDRIKPYLGAILPRDPRSGSTVCIVPPGKKELNPVLKSIWEVAEERLINADELIIIGCSLNPDDKELIELLKKGPDKIKIISLDNQVSQSYIHREEKAYHSDLGKRYKAYPYGFNLHAPGGGQGAIEFIFS